MKDVMREMLYSVKQAVLVSVVLMLICGLLYPCAMTGLSALLFPDQANGSLLIVEGKAVGAANVGQEFTQNCYLWGRPSAYHYNTYVEGADGKRYYQDGTEFAGLASGSSNYGPSNPALAERVEADMTAFLQKNPTVAREEIPTDLLTASGSGLDPHISPAAADVQVARIAAARGIAEQEVRKVIAACSEDKLFRVFGEPTVNVLKVNLMLDGLLKQ